MQLKTLRLYPIASLAVILVAGGTVAGESSNISVKDDRGVEVQPAATPRRIAAVSYLAVDEALALGIKPVAATYMTAGREPDFLLGLTKDIKPVGQRAKPNLELLSEAKPDIIFAMKRYTNCQR